MQIAGLDIGTQNIKLIVADLNNKGDLRILKVLRVPSGGMRRGAIVDMDEVVAATSDIFSLLRKQYKAAGRNIFVNINGPQITTHISKGIVAVSRADSEIYKDDIDRVIKASQAISLSPNRRIIHTITKEFVVDGIRDIADPAGLVGNRLEVESLLVDAFDQYIKNLTRLVEVHGVRIGGLILGVLAGGKAALGKQQMELGVALIDVGAFTTGMSVYEEGKLLHAAVIPIGANHITNDIAVGFKMPVVGAENLKLNFGYAVSRQVAPKESVELRLVDAGMRSGISRRYLSEIIESRFAEILDFVNNELKKIGKSGQLPGGAVLIGGGSKLPGVAELAKQELRLSSELGMIGHSFGIDDPDYHGELEDPEFICSAGLVLWGAEESKKGSAIGFRDWGNPVTSFLKSFVRNLLP